MALEHQKKKAMRPMLVWCNVKEARPPGHPGKRVYTSLSRSTHYLGNPVLDGEGIIFCMLHERRDSGWD